MTEAFICESCGELYERPPDVTLIAARREGREIKVYDDDDQVDLCEGCFGELDIFETGE